MKQMEEQLFQAIESNDVTLIEHLISEDIDMSNFILNTGYSPLEYAVEVGNLEIVRALIASVIDINVGVSQHPLEVAIQSGRHDIATIFLQAGADVNRDLGDGWTFLMRAANAGHLGIIKLLVESGANVNATTAHGVSPLMCALREGWQEVFDYLAPLTIPELRQTTVIELPNNLIHQRPDVKWIEKFIDAAGQGDVNAIRNFISSGIDINFVDVNGNNALHFATLHGKLDVVQLLVEAGAKLELKHKRYGTTPLVTAVKRGRSEIVQFLINSGADVHTNYEGETLLNLAVEQGIRWRKTPEHRGWYMEIIQTLIREGVDINAKNTAGRKTIEIATDNVDLEILQLLEEAKNKR